MAMFSYEFMRRALFASFFMAMMAPMLGVFLVIRRQSLLADTLSHVSLAGVALGFFFQVNPTWTTLVIVVITAIILEYLRTLYISYSEVATAIVMSGGLALALVLMDRSQGNSSMKIQQYLFGSIVTVTWDQVWFLGILCAIILLLFLLFHRMLYVLIFDEQIAHVDGLPTRLMAVVFNICIGVAITLMIPIAGALLVSAIMILPAAIAMRLGNKFLHVIGLSMLLGLCGMIAGLMTSYTWDSPSGATITLVYIVLFLVVLMIQRVLQWTKRKKYKK